MASELVRMDRFSAAYVPQPHEQADYYELFFPGAPGLGAAMVQTKSAAEVIASLAKHRGRRHSLRRVRWLDYDPAAGQLAGLYAQTISADQLVDL